MIVDYLKKYYLDREINCAESMLRATAESRGLDLPEVCCHALDPFGGGVSSEHLCGAICGGVAAAGALLNRGDEESLDAAKDVASRLMTVCEEKFGTVLCGEIMPGRRMEDIRCYNVLVTIAGLLEPILPPSDRAENG